MSYDRSERIRRAAILVASLEETMAEQLLDSLPPDEATRILAEADRLGELEPEELQDVLHEFRAAGRRGKSNDEAVEFTYSAPQVGLRREGPVETPVAPVDAEALARQEADAALMAELLMHEHPQIVAAALSRLGHEQGAAVFARLPIDVQTEVLDRLARLEPADEEVVQEIEQQLHQRVEQQRERRARSLAATELARRMLEKTPAAQRDVLLARLSPTGPGSTTESRIVTNSAPATIPQLERLRDISSRWSASPAEDNDNAEPEHFEAWTEAPAPSAPGAPVSLRILLEDRSDDLESLDDRSLLEALRLADERTVQCALAASSERFLNRVAGKLPRRQAQRLRQMVRSIGPTRLTELREAQYELLRLAHGSGTSVAA